MKGVFQLLDTRDGSRSDVRCCTSSEFGYSISKALRPVDREPLMVLCLFECDDSGDGEFSNLPILSLDRFIELNCVEEIQLDG